MIMKCVSLLFCIIKRFHYTICRGIRKLKKTLLYFLPYSLLVVSVLISLFLLVPTCFDRVPTLSYLIHKHELPITYDLVGTVMVLDTKDDIVTNNIVVYVGGYSTTVEPTSEFSLTFSSPCIDKVFVVVQYELDGKLQESTSCITVEDNSHTITAEITIYVGDI